MRSLSLHIPTHIVNACVHLLESHSFEHISWFEDTASSTFDVLDENGFPKATHFFVDALLPPSFDLSSDLRHFETELHHLALIHELTPLSYEIRRLDSFYEHDACFSKKIGLLHLNSKISETENAKQSPMAAIKSSFEKFPGKYLSLQIRASTAFGSGDHPTTQGCIKAIQFLKKTTSKDTPFTHILDLGTGSGILALTCQRFWPYAHLYASDIDPESIRVTKKNTKDNHVFLKTEVASGFHHRSFLHQKYDLIVANILARPLKGLSIGMNTHIKEKTCLVLSGLLTRQKNDVLNTYRLHGFFLYKELKIDEWSTLILSKKNNRSVA